MTFMHKLSQRIAQRAAYLRTKHALEKLTIDAALDLDIYRGDAALIASKAVYG